MKNNLLVVFIVLGVLAVVSAGWWLSSGSKTPPLGAVSGPVIDGSFLTVGGVEKAYLSQPLTATSSTVCSFLNPFKATSTVLAIGVSRSSTGIAGTQAFYISTTSSTGRYGSSTPAFVDNHQEGAANFALAWTAIVSTSTPRVGVLQTYQLDGNSSALLGPNEALTVRIATGSPGTFASYMVGKCTAELQKL